MDKKEIEAMEELRKAIKNNKETITKDEMYTEEEAKNILNLLKKKRPRIDK